MFQIFLKNLKKTMILLGIILLDSFVLQALTDAPADGSFRIYNKSNTKVKFWFRMRDQGGKDVSIYRFNNNKDKDYDQGAVDPGGTLQYSYGRKSQLKQIKIEYYKTDGKTIDSTAIMDIKNNNYMYPKAVYIYGDINVPVNAEYSQDPQGYRYPPRYFSYWRKDIDMSKNDTIDKAINDSVINTNDVSIYRFDNEGKHLIRVSGLSEL